MPLKEVFEINPNIHILLWEVTEKLSCLKEMYKNKGFNEIEHIDKIEKFSSENRKKEWLATRLLLYSWLKKTTRIVYDYYGKPSLFQSNDGLSISHSDKFIVVVVGKDRQVGIDIQKITPKIQNVAQRFLNEKEKNIPYLLNNTLKLTLYWCAKETIYKIHGKKMLSFSENIIIQNVNENESDFEAFLMLKDKEVQFKMYYFAIENFLIVWTEKEEL